METETNNHTTLGKVSLWSAIMGFALPILISSLTAALASSLRLDHDAKKTVIILSVVLCVGLELTAFVTGILARKTGTGKAGLIISSICFGLAVLSSGLVLLRVDQRTDSIQQEKASMRIQVEEARIQAQKRNDSSLNTETR